MNIIVFLIGIVLLLIVITDFFHTTLSFQGSGIVTRFVHRSKWKAVQGLARVFGKRMLNYGGLFVSIAMLVSWVLLLWLGLFLVFHSDPAAVVSNDKFEHPADVWERVYYTGFVLSTLGLGDLKPDTTWARIFTAVFSFSGFIFFTASMTYLLSVSSAIVQKRSLAMYIHDLGRSPQDTVINGWNGSDLSLLKDDLSTLKQSVNLLTQSHKAFPILHYFILRDRRASISINMARLDDTLTVILHHLKEIDPATRKEAGQLRSAIDHYLEMVVKELGTEQGEAWPRPDIDRILANGIPINQEQAADQQQIGERRRIFSGYLRFEGWNANDV